MLEGSSPHKQQKKRIKSKVYGARAEIRILQREELLQLVA